MEIFSLLEEQIPKYRVRADTTTTFGGYENQDWFVNYPALPIPQDGLGLTIEQTREALNYFRKYKQFISGYFLSPLCLCKHHCAKI